MAHPHPFPISHPEVCRTGVSDPHAASWRLQSELPRCPRFASVLWTLTWAHSPPSRRHPLPDHVPVNLPEQELVSETGFGRARLPQAAEKLRFVSCFERARLQPG